MRIWRKTGNLHAAIFNSVRDPIIEDKETPAKDKTFNVLSKAGWSLTSRMVVDSNGIIEYLQRKM